jgi:TonB-dependent starch-binding outer membrane protein SusC
MNMNKFLRFTVTPLMFLLILAGTGYGQNLTVQGKITDSRTGDVLVGVNIVVQGTITGTISDANGNYSINVPSANSTLVYSYIGYTVLSVPVNGKTTLNVSLSEEAKALDEIVVIGYGTQKKSDLTGSITVVKTEEVAKAASNDVTKALQGKVAGLSIQSGGEPGATPLVKLRGISSFNNTTPLYIIDGVATPVNDFPMN